MALSSLFRSKANKATMESAAALYAAIVAQARAPVFFAELGVPDTLDGRFEMVTLHAFLVIDRLRQAKPETDEFAQALFDTMFLDLDRGLREIGVADLGVGRRIKTMIQAFYGRAHAYGQGLTAGETELQAALRRNLYGTVEPRPSDLAAMAGYLRRQHEALADSPVAELMAGRLTFAPPDTASGQTAP